MDPSRFIKNKDLISKPRSTIGSGAKEINESWVGKLKKTAADEEDDLVDESVADLISVENEEIATVESTVVTASESKSTGERRYKKGTQKGSSDQERRAIKEYNPDSRKSPEQIEAFLDGFRMKQDYTLITMKAQMDQLQRLVDTLTSATTSISRVSCDLVAATESSTSKLAMCITSHLGQSKERANTVNTGSKSETPAVQKTGQKKDTPLKQVSTVIENIGKSNKEEVERIVTKRDEEIRSVIADEPIEKEKTPLIVAELENIMGMKVDQIKTFYSITDAQVVGVLSSYYGPLGQLVASTGGMVPLKGKMKRSLIGASKQ